ncbi:MAG: hypothetical protein QTN59_19345 [Candidatus Electrothrix communis]|nr:MAG: hypothetical protein QTN59_19345 [Candidatus Electrothrix communis]
MHRYDSRERRPRGRRPGFEKKVNLAEKQRESAEAELLKARENGEGAIVAMGATVQKMSRH